MDDPFEFSSRRRRSMTFFSPLANKLANSLTQCNQSDATPTSSRTTGSADLRCIIEAIQSNDVDSLLELLEQMKTIDVNKVVPMYSMTLLHLSVGFSENEPKIVKILLRMGGDPNNTEIEEKLSPLHLSAVYDFDRVMNVLIEYGGDPKIPTGEGKSCFDIVKRNVEDELLENCFAYLFPRSRDFRKSMGSCLGTSQQPKPSEISNKGHDSSDGFHSCNNSQLDSAGNTQYYSSDRLHSIARKLYPFDYTNFMTEDESENTSDDDDGRKKLTTIPEESGIITSSPQQLVAASPAFTPSPFGQPRRRGIASMTAPLYLTDDSISNVNDSGSGPSCVNSTPPITPQPSKADLAKLQLQMQQLNIPITPSTFGVISKFSESESRLQKLQSPKTGLKNFSPELQAGVQDMTLISEWGNLRIEFLQKEQQQATPTKKPASKSFYNYLLLDPRILKKTNFSGDHLKTGVINNGEKFQKFLESVFYIGKGHAKRALQHLVEAKEKYNEIGRKPLKNGEKIDKILQIWKSGMGVMIVSMFHHNSESEACVNEASMIDAIGLVELSNAIKGSYAGTVAQGWPQKTKNQLGSFLLLNCFRCFVVSEHKMFYPKDFPN